MTIPIDTNKHKCNNIFINNRRSINTMILKSMILDAIQSKLATLREMNYSGNIDCVDMDIILDELKLLSKIITYHNDYKVERINERAINVKLYYDTTNVVDTTTDGINIEF